MPQPTRYLFDFMFIFLSKKLPEVSIHILFQAFTLPFSYYLLTFIESEFYFILNEAFRIYHDA